MDEVKSIRIRKRISTSEENLGSSDIKIVLYRKRQRRSVKGFSINPAGDELLELWKEARYEGDRYENLSDDAIIDDFIRLNTLAERPQGDKIKIGFPSKEVTYYEKIQDPFQRTVPIRRSFGFDPYYLNNGSQVNIKWFEATLTEVEWTYSNSTTSTMSATGSVQIKIETNQPNRPPLYFYYTKNTPPFNGLTPSYIDVYLLWDSYTSLGMNQIAGLSANGFQYALPGDSITDTDSLVSHGGVEYSKQVYDNGKYMGIIENSEIISPKFIRRVEVYPPKDSDGDYVDQPFAIEAESSDYPSSFVFSYISDIRSNDQKDYKYFIDETGLNALQSGTTFSYLRDFVLLDGLIQAWKSKIPQYKELSFGACSPDYKECSLIQYISPIKPADAVEAQLEAISNADAPGTSPSTTSSTMSQLNFLFPDDFDIIVRQDVPDFKIFVGDIPSQEIEGAFIYQEPFEEQQVDDEYLEGGFTGAEEELPEGEADAPDPLPTDTGTTTTTDEGTVGADGAIVNVEASPPGTGPSGKLVKKVGKGYYVIDAESGLAGHRLKNVPKDLTKHLKANGYPGAKIGSNGVMRDLHASTYPSNPARIAGSYHGAGLAVDVTFSIPGFKWASYDPDNKNLAVDEKLTKVIAAFVKAQGDLVWGASFDSKKGSAPDKGIVKGRGILEYHHFELKQSKMPDYWKPFKSELDKYGLDYKILNNSTNLTAAYKKFLAAFGVTK